MYKQLTTQNGNIKVYLLFFIGSILFIQSCSSWKNYLNKDGNYEIAIKNAIIDFCATSSLANKDRTFYINYREYDSGIIGVSILGDINKIYLLHDIPQSRVPEQYFEYDKKLFYWYDDKKIKNPNIIKKLSEYKVINNVTSITEDMGFIRDEDKDGVNYFFCRENLLIYKKEKTSIALPKGINNNLICQ